jgi:ornithine cyclodeaminase/alanine dehydrogenase-like protein (mu-crystallin family)
MPGLSVRSFWIRRGGRRTATEITVCKAMGVGMEDLVASKLAYSTAGEIEQAR